MDMDGCCVAATTNPLYRLMEQRIKAKLGLPDRRAYFNSGVLLFDLDAMRTDGLDKQLVEWAVEHRDAISWPDQDVLNAVLWRRRLPLHPRWNAASGLWDLPARDLPWTEEQVAEARRNPAIAHFLGPFKPWHYRCTHPYRNMYQTYLTQTGLTARPQVGRTRKNQALRRLPALAQWTAENGPAELEAELKYRLLSTRAGVEARDAYRTIRGQHPGPVERVLEALDAVTREIVFVQVGSNDGEHDDPLRRFILAGKWRGVLIEPVPYLFERLRNAYRGRTGITPVNAAIGLEDGTAQFFAIAPAQSDEEVPEWYDQIGSFSREHILKHADYIPRLEERIVAMEVPTLSFETLFAHHRIDRIDVLHIDAEGYDFELIKALDVARRRPRLLMFEYKHLSDEDLVAARRLLDDAGYDTIDVAWDTLAIRRDEIGRRSSHLARAWKAARQSAVAARV
jgi:FkbM family methyltransferase